MKQIEEVLELAKKLDAAEDEILSGLDEDTADCAREVAGDLRRFRRHTKTCPEVRTA